jgi:hypothetical protein
MSAPFQKAHADHIQSTYKAVNHGIQVKSMEQLAADAAGGRNMEAAYSSMMKQAAVGMVKGLRSMPIDSAKQAFEEDLKSWTRQAASKSSSRALWQKLAARAKEIAPLASSQPEEFKKEYSLLKSLEMGGPGTEAELFSIANSAQHQQQQLAWNQFNLKDLVKRNLTAFVATAATVDFTAKTAQVGTQTKFVNPAYEKKSNLWKALFRAGQAPVAAAVDLAKAWLKELG